MTTAIHWPRAFPARNLVDASHIGRCSFDSFAIWHLGGGGQTAYCGRRFAGVPHDINSSDTYDREWVCATCLRHALPER